MATWRAMQSGDIARVIALADSLHPGLTERPEVFAERQRLFPRGCLVAERDVYGTEAFWSRFGFRPSLKDMGAKLAGYGEDAVYMERHRIHST